MAERRVALDGGAWPGIGAVVTRLAASGRDLAPHGKADGVAVEAPAVSCRAAGGRA